MHSNSVLKSSSTQNFVSDFAFGIMTPIRAVGLIFTNRRLLTLSLAPIAATLILISFAIYAVIAGFGGFFRQWLMTTLHGALAEYSSGLSMLLSSLLGVALIFFALNSILILSSLMASPFNDLIAESTERAISIQDIPETTFKQLVRVFFVDLRKTIITVVLSLTFTILMLIPAIGVAFFAGVALLNTFTFVTYPQSRRLHGVRASIAWVKANLGLALGFGFMTTVLFGFPVLNLFALPVSVVGGTLLYFRKKPSL